MRSECSDLGKNSGKKVAKPYDAGKSLLLEAPSWANVQSGPKGGRQAARARSSELSHEPWWAFHHGKRRSESRFTSPVVKQLIPQEEKSTLAQYDQRGSEMQILVPTKL